MQRKIVIKFLSEWQVSSGIGDGYLADNKISRDSNGFPYIPGRAVKGALREGATLLSGCEGRDDLKNVNEIIFGTASQDDKVNQAGIIRVGGAHLDEDLASFLNSLDDDSKLGVLKDMISYRSETRLKEDKQVVDGSLRRLECGIPELELEADIEIENSSALSEEWLDSYLSAVCAAVKSIGGDRARGLGKCRITVKGKELLKVNLPEVLKGDVQ